MWLPPDGTVFQLEIIASYSSIASAFSYASTVLQLTHWTHRTEESIFTLPKQDENGPIDSYITVYPQLVSLASTGQSALS